MFRVQTTRVNLNFTTEEKKENKGERIRTKNVRLRANEERRNRNRIKPAKLSSSSIKSGNVRIRLAGIYKNGTED